VKHEKNHSTSKGRPKKKTHVFQNLSDLKDFEEGLAERKQKRRRKMVQTRKSLPLIPLFGVSRRRNKEEKEAA